MKFYNAAATLALGFALTAKPAMAQQKASAPKSTAAAPSKQDIEALREKYRNPMIYGHHPLWAELEDKCDELEANDPEGSLFINLPHREEVWDEMIPDIDNLVRLLEARNKAVGTPGEAAAKVQFDNAFGRYFLKFDRPKIAPKQSVDSHLLI